MQSPKSDLDKSPTVIRIHKVVKNLQGAGYLYQQLQDQNHQIYKFLLQDAQTYNALKV